MSRETRLNRTVRRAIERRLKDTEAKEPPLRKKFVAILLFLIGVPGIIAGILSLLPRVNATLSEPSDPNNPFSATVTVVNTGYIPLSAVESDFAVKKIEYGNPAQPMVFRSDTGSYDVIVKDLTRTPVYLGIDDRFSYDLDAQFQGPPSIVRANIAIAVRYELPIIHLKQEKLFPEVAARRADTPSSRQVDGKFHWHSLTLEN